MIYLDNNATTPIAPEVREAMLPFLTELYGNPSSAHTLGRSVRAAVEHARDHVAELLGAREAKEIVFTSCGTESDNWAIRGALELFPHKRHIVTTRVEHEAVRNLCEHLARHGGYEVTWLDVDADGLLDLESLRVALRPDTCIVSVMLANNETGVLFPVEEIGRIVRENSTALFHVDGVQAVGKIPLNLRATEIDLFSMSGHKLYAPKGVGALYIRDGVQLPSLMIGGGQERGRRAGTENVAYIAAMGRACELAKSFLDISNGKARVRGLRDTLEDEILRRIPNAQLNGAKNRAHRLPNTSNISFAYVDGDQILAHLDAHGIAVSTGSACNAESRVASSVLRAMNVPYDVARGSIRFSVGRDNTEDEIAEVLRVLPEIINKLIELSPYEDELSALTGSHEQRLAEQAFSATS